MTNASGVFVDVGGDDANDGTKALPVRTITRALSVLGSRSRVFLCGGGPFAETVKLNRSVSLYGGFACGTWIADNVRARIEPGTTGPALTIRDAPDPVEIFDIEITVKDGSSPSESSIGLFASKASSVLVRRSRIVTGRGRAGTSAAAPASNHFVGDMRGRDASSTTAGAAKICACRVSGSSEGGGGGAPIDISLGGDGASGKATPATLPVTVNGGVGAEGGDPPAYQGRGAKVGTAGSGGVGGKLDNPVGTVDEDGFVVAVAGAGGAGRPGQGGGGGGGSSTSAAPPLAGGGGGCGGCGGSGGGAGVSGGSSIAVLAFSSTLRIEESQLVVAAGGAGGNGASGEIGQLGGGLGNSDCVACRGSDGARGGGGGGGAGGAGGSAFGTLSKDGKVVVDPLTLITLPSAPAAGGLAGKGGVSTTSGGDGAAGTPGLVLASHTL